MKFHQFRQNLRRFLCLGLSVGFIFLATITTHAAPVSAKDAADVVQQRAESELDRVVGAGTSQQIKGKIQEDIGRTQRQFGDTEGELKGAASQVKGRATRDIGRTRSAAEDAAEDLQNSVDNAADQVEDSTKGFAESVKDFFN